MTVLGIASLVILLLEFATRVIEGYRQESVSVLGV